jgi:hypothetical protein
MRNVAWRRPRRGLANELSWPPSAPEQPSKSRQSVLATLAYCLELFVDLKGVICDQRHPVGHRNKNEANRPNKPVGDQADRTKSKVKYWHSNRSGRRIPMSLKACPAAINDLQRGCTPRRTPT